MVKRRRGCGVIPKKGKEGRERRAEGGIERERVNKIVQKAAGKGNRWFFDLS